MRVIITVQPGASNLLVSGSLPFKRLQFLLTSKGFETKCIRINHEFKDGIEKSVLKITDWDHKDSRLTTNGDHEGQFFLSHPHTNNGFFF